MTEQHRIRLDNLEALISDALMMASITATLAGKFGQDLMEYRNAPRMAAPTVAIELSDDVDRLRFAAFRLEEMLRELMKDYMAPLEDPKAA